jgi:hypothetical protein
MLEDGEDCIMKSFVTCSLHQILFFFPMAFYSPLRTYAFLNGLLNPIDIW